MQVLYPIMLIRHAEKPLPDSRNADDAAGAGGKRGLSPRGERRARLLVEYFAPLHDVLRDGHTRTPKSIFAAASTSVHRSTRPADTVRPLAQALGLNVREDFSSDPPFDEAAAGLKSAASRGPVLVSWRYDTLPELARSIGAQAVPAVWPASRFDMIWVLEQAGDAWRLTQIPQLLLPEDTVTPIGGAEQA